jgi:hypothetical protein
VNWHIRVIRGFLFFGSRLQAAPGVSRLLFANLLAVVSVAAARR